MFDQGFTFKRGAWHARLMKYTWNLSHRDFDYMCPYFWLTVFNVIIAPVFLPVKFSIQTIFWRILWKGGIVPFTVWCYEGVERVLKAMGDKLDEWAIKEQQKWTERREREMREFNGKAMKFLESIPDNILQTGIKLTQNRLHLQWPDDYIFHNVRYDDEIEFWQYYEKMTKKQQKMWKILEGITTKDKKTSAKIVETIAERNSSSLEHNSFSPFVVIPETEEQRLTRLERERKAKEAEIKRKAEIAAKEAEKERVRKLREEEAEQRRKVERDKYLLRMERKRNAKIRNKQRINKILKIVKPIATAAIWVVGITVAIIGIFLLIKGVIWVVDGFGSVKQTTYNSIWRVISIVLKWIGIVVGGALIILGIIIGSDMLIKYIKSLNIPLPKMKKRVVKEKVVSAEEQAVIERRHIEREQKIEDFCEGLANVFSAIGSIFPPILRVTKYIFKFIGKLLKLLLITPFVKTYKGIVVFVQIVRQTYNDNCPPITWKD